MQRTIKLLLVFAMFSATANAEDWVRLFDGKSLKGWKANENTDTWKIEDGAMVCHGERSHLFYVGDDKPFVNFEFKCDVMTTPGSNAGIYFHTQYQDEGWPKFGYECQVNVTHRDPKKSGSLYAVENVDADGLKNLIKDDEWYTQHITVRGNKITLKINDKVVVEYTEPKDKEAFGKNFERMLNKGTFAFQGHDPDSKVYFKNVMVKRLDN